MTIDEIAKDILDTNDETKVLEDVSEAIHDYIDDDWEDEFEDIHEAYSEQGRGEAESQILTQILDTWQNENKTKLTTDEWCDVWDILKDEWCLTTD